MKELHQRKKIRLKGYNYSSAGYYFVTVCVKDKHEMLGRMVGDGVPDVPPTIELSEYGMLVKQFIKNILILYIRVFW